jgi:hypothetical protein
MTIIEQLNAAGWTVTEDRAERGDWSIELYPAVAMLICPDWSPHGFEVASAPDLSALMAAPFGSSTVGAFCGVLVPLSGTVVERLGKAGWTVHRDEDGDLDAMRDTLSRDEPGLITAKQDKASGAFSAALGGFPSDCPSVHGHTSEEAALAALMALPFGAVTVGDFCGVTNTAALHNAPLALYEENEQLRERLATVSVTMPLEPVDAEKARQWWLAVVERAGADGSTNAPRDIVEFMPPVEFVIPAVIHGRRFRKVTP